MAALTITDPHKKDQLINDFLTTRRNIQLDNLNERIGDIEMKRETTKLFSPIIESQQKTAEATQKAISNIPNKLPIEQHLPQTLSLATKGSKLGDTSFGLYSSSGKLYIGNKETIIDSNSDIIIDGNKYKGTPGLLELITSKDPQNYTQDDRNTYKEILNTTGALWTKNDPNTKRVKSGTGDKYYNIIKPIREEIMGQKSLPAPDNGQSPAKSISTLDSKTLLERYRLLKGSLEAGHTNVDSEMSTITDELYRRGDIDEEQYRTQKNK